MSAKVVKTDGDFTDLQIERAVLGRVGAELVELHEPSPEELVARARDADALMVLAYPVTRELLEELAQVKVVSRYGVGVDVVDVKAATSLGVPVAYTPQYCVDEVSTHAVALLLAVWRKLAALNRHAADGTFPAIRAVGPLRRLAGSRVGLVGFGTLGRAVARKLSGFDLEIVATDPKVPAHVFSEHNVRRVDLDELVETADIVSLHASLTPATFHLIGEGEIARMKPGAIVVNTGRGALIDQVHLTAALRDGRLGGAGLDVLEKEPPSADDELLRLPNVVVTPHVAAYSKEAISMLQERAASAVADVLGGTRPAHLANPEVWEHRRR
ncbi:MAG: C-terminal binding protein [Actinomycetota bacterium]|jgi:D-3-phosphoglycerate dehydrogenase|nr:C-terminal binding protein [Actinomycetota bacterium]